MKKASELFNGGYSIAVQKLNPHLRKLKVNKTSKYKNHKIEYKGEIFDSKKELNDWIGLCFQEKIGEISDLKRQVPFVLIEKQKGERSVKYIADFVYKQNQKNIVGDSKSIFTKKDKVYIIKRKLFKMMYPQYTFKEFI